MARTLARARQAIQRVTSDGWANLLSGLGIQNRDASVSTQYVQRVELDQQTCRALYLGEWACGRMVDDLSHDATRAGFDLESDGDPTLADQVEQLWSELAVERVLQDGFRWGLTFGGAVGVMLTDDTPQTFDVMGVLSTPLVPGSYSKVVRIVIVERQWAVPNMGQIDLDPASPNYGMPMVYTVSPQFGGGSPTWQVHWTRILRFDGQPVDSLTRVANLSYGDSIFQRPFDVVRGRGAAISATSAIVQRFTQGVISMAGLLSSLVSEQEGDVQARLRAFNLGMGVTSLGVIDAESEKFELLGQPVNGLQGLLMELRTELAGALNYPQARLYGAQAGALASAETDEKQWAATVHSWQTLRVLPPLQRLTTVMLQARGAPQVGKWQIKPRPIQAPNAKADVEVRKLQAEVDLQYIQAGVLEPVEVRTSRFAGAVYSTTTTLDPQITAAIEASQQTADDDMQEPPPVPEVEPPEVA